MADSRVRLIVIGGGPSGLMAAGQAALLGIDVTLLEKKDDPARKLRITGNGRCNLTNTLPSYEFIRHFGPNGKFLRPSLGKFSSSDLIHFFENLGVKLTSDERGRIYPKSNDANQIADTLLKWAKNNGVKIICRAPVKNLLRARNIITGVQSDIGDRSFAADKIIIATGGASYPNTGSTGDGYSMAKDLGHSVVPIRAASVPLITAGDLAQKLKGISLNQVLVTVRINEKSMLQEKGDLIFTHYGVSGPAILPLSRFCIDQFANGNRVALSIDLLPDHEYEFIDQTLLDMFINQGRSKIQTILANWMPTKMATIILASMGMGPSKICSQISSAERQKIRESLKDLRLAITGHRPLSEAMVTAGGISLKEIDPRTMESRLIRGLYFAGEVLDLEADTGGFNLQAAFSTGWVAGRAAASS